MRGVIPSEPKFRVTVNFSNARCFSVGTEIPANSYVFKFELFFGRIQNSGQELTIKIRGIVCKQPKFGGALAYLNAGSYSLVSKSEGKSHQFKCENSALTGSVDGENSPRGTPSHFPLIIVMLYRREML